MVYIYDLEQFKNFHSGIFLNIETEEVHTFILDRDREEYLAFLKTVKGLIGFNNIGYDYPLLHHIINNPTITSEELYNVSQEIINGNYTTYHKRAKYDKHVIPQLDLYLIHHFNNVAKACSLKWCEFAMRWENLQDLPLKFDSFVEESQYNDILRYNLNDVLATYELYKQTKPKIELRKRIGNRFNDNFINDNDVKIGTKILGNYLSRVKGYDITKSEGTERKKIVLKDIIFDYVLFNSKEFNKVYKELLSKTITNTKGVFNDLYVNYKGIKYVYGVGGLHACIEPGIYNADDEYMIVDIDVASYYPNLSIKNKLYPKHLGEEFCIVYEDIYVERKAAKKSGDKAMDAGYKLSLNGSYGFDIKYSTF